MTFDARVVRVMIASPSDTIEFRDAVEQSLHRWNRDRAAGARVILLPVRWEFDAVPTMADEDPQLSINRQLVDQADLVIGIFYSRLGLATSRAVSGSAEELEHAREAGLPVHVYFANMPLPAATDPEQLGAMRTYRNDLQTKRLTGSFNSTYDLATQVYSAVEADVQALGVVVARPNVVTPSASLRARYGKWSGRDVLVVRNDGDEIAKAVVPSLRVLSIDSPARMLLYMRTAVAPDIPPHGGEFQFALDIRGHDYEATVEVTLSWTDLRAEQHQTSHSISLV